ncbi:MAG: hypothetical protein ACE5IW_04065 [bacterium]
MKKRFQRRRGIRGRRTLPPLRGNEAPFEPESIIPNQDQIEGESMKI